MKLARLTETRCNFDLPELPRFTKRGTNTLLYRKTESKLLVFSVDDVKLEYWRELGLTSYINYAGEAEYPGQKKAPVYWCEVPILNRPDRSRWNEIKETVYQAMLIKDRYYDHIEQWTAISQLPYMKRASSFVLNYNPDLLYFDCVPDEFLLWKEEVVPIDPFVSRTILDLIHTKS